MVRLYATLIIKGERTIEEVPKKIREQVRQELTNRGYGFVEPAEDDAD